MQIISDLQQSLRIKELLLASKTIGVIGLSPNENRPSNMVARYLMENGYTIFPVNPGQDEILDQPCYGRVSDIPQSMDIIDVFRRSEEVLPLVEQVLSLPALPKMIWMQQGILNEEAAELARSSGIYVVMDRCIKIDHANLVAGR